MIAGDYILESTLSRGGFGVVYRARRAADGRPCAVKVLHMDLFSDPVAALRFDREARVILSLDHPGVVRIHDHGRLDDGRPFLAMDLLEGEDLGELVRRGPLSAREALSILEPLSQALAAVHAAGILHRDIKPSNVFLERGGRVVLLDFGLAKLLSGAEPSLTASGAAVGTLPFMSPEQIRDEALDVRADVYAVAALTYAMLTGQPPYGSRTSAALHEVHLRARPEPPSRRGASDPRLDEPILAALSFEPDARPPTVPAFVASLQRALSAPDPRASPPGSPGEGRVVLMVFCSVRASPALGAGERRSDDLLDALEGALPLVQRELARVGMVPVNETASELLSLLDSADPAASAPEVVAACQRAYEGVTALGRGRIELAMAVRSDALRLDESGAILNDWARDARSWARAPQSGLDLSEAVQRLLPSG